MPITFSFSFLTSASHSTLLTVSVSSSFVYSAMTFQSSFCLSSIPESIRSCRCIFLKLEVTLSATLPLLLHIVLLLLFYSQFVYACLQLLRKLCGIMLVINKCGRILLQNIFWSIIKKPSPKPKHFIVRENSNIESHV